MTANLTTKSGRDRLPVRREPYWIKLESGKFLGFRVAPTGAFWIARCRIEGRQTFSALGSAASLGLDEAKRAAEAWFASAIDGEVGSAGTTVAEAFQCYADALESEGRADAAHEARRRCSLLIESDRIGSLRLDRLTLPDVAGWRDRIRKGRSPATVNRNLRTLKAALSRAVKMGLVGNQDAWRNVEVIRDSERSRTIFLDLDQRRALLAASPERLRSYLAALMHVGCRPGELVRATVADLDTRSRTLTLRSFKGRGAALRVRAFPLSVPAFDLLQDVAKGRQGNEPLFLNAEGRPWQRSNLARCIRLAATAAGLPDGTVAYTLRHSALSEWLNAGIDPVTVAKLGGTSVAMIEAHYYKLMRPAVLDRLSAIEVA